MKKYNFEQQVYSLSLTSNISFGQKFKTLKALQDYVHQKINGLLSEPSVHNLIGEWDVIWGPYTYCHYADKDKLESTGFNPYHSDNTMFLAHSPTKNQYVLSVAGTNGISIYGWFLEDFNASKMKNWSELCKNKGPIDAKISKGTFDGMDILLNKIHKQYKESSDSIVDFLANCMKTAQSGATLAVTGHSLGGALSPALATYLKDCQSQWDPSGRVNVLSTYPTAGPTPGNYAFAKHMEDVIGVNYHASYNKLDVVPHAWQTSMMKEISTIYSDCGIDSSIIIKEIITYCILRTEKNNYAQAQPLTSLPGTCNSTDMQSADEIIDQISAEKMKELESFTSIEKLELSKMIKFLNQAIYQHTKAYQTLLNIIEFSKLFGKEARTESNILNLLLLIKAISKLYEVCKNKNLSTS